MRRLLVANRGEIALRIFRACRAEGVETVAVVAPDDRGALHAESADAVVEIASYLDPAEHVRAARETEADAVHPGYGFLSETAELAEAVLEARLTWVGPPPAALRAGGDKLARRRPRAPESPSCPADPGGDRLPLLVKAAAGGGGRGMRVVRAAESSTRRSRRHGEAAAFGDDTVFCERYLERPRHVEISSSPTGRTVSALGERDCSIQRRHRRCSRSPPRARPGVAHADERRAVSFARATYESAGTSGSCSTAATSGSSTQRPDQVEHPVTGS